MKSPLLFAVVVISSSFVFADSALAQPTDQQRARRRALMEDLLRGLIESQTHPQHDERAEQLPGQVAPRPVRPSMPPTHDHAHPDHRSREMASVEQQLDQWSAKSQQLINELRVHEYESPELRPHLAEALQIQASIDILRQRAVRAVAPQQLVHDFAAVDRDWRKLAYKLKQSGALSAECRGLVNAIVEFDSTLCDLFGIEPQIDRNELLRLTSEFSSQFKHLLQDVYYQTRNNPDSQQLIRQGQELYALINQSTALIPRGSHAAIVDAYKAGHTKWRAFSRQVNALRDPRIRRDVQQIESIGRQIHEALWLPIEMDRDQVEHLSNAITAESVHMFEDVSIQRLLQHPHPEKILESVRSFQGSAQSFARGVKKGKSADELAWDYWLFEKQWKKIDRQFRQIKMTAIDQHLEEIQFLFASLGQSFGRHHGYGDTIAISHSDLVQLAANLDQLAHSLNEEVHRRTESRHYDDSFRNRVSSLTDVLHETAHDFHRDTLRQHQAQVNSLQLRTLLETWNQLRPTFQQFRRSDQSALAPFRSEIEPLMVKMQVVFAP